MSLGPDATWQVLVLGAVQGLTEFLPVSSSGHLVLAEALLGFQQPGIALEIVLHLGTLLAVVAYYRHDLASILSGSARFLRGERGEQERRAISEVALLALGTIPAVIGAILFGGLVERAFEDPRGTCLELMMTGVLLLSTFFLRGGSKSLAPGRALGVGGFQMWALFPGISRSGATIAGGLILGLRPEEAARFSFLLSIPAILGAAIFKGRELQEGFTAVSAPLFLGGFLVSLVLGYLSIGVLLRFVKRGRFGFFGIYCLMLGGLGLWYLSR